MRPRVLIAALAAVLVPAATAQAGVIELGVTPERPDASCPRNCEAIGRVTGYQVSQKGVRGEPFKVRRPGRIVAWSVRLGRPDKGQVDFFTQTYGGPPRARLSILRERPRRVRQLVAHSEVENLSRYLGSNPTFALDRSLPVRAGDIVAITVPTWAPAFSIDLPAEEAWRSSRRAGDCANVKQRAAQQRLRGLRTYGCLYRTARLRYSASFVPTPKPTS